jgi:dTDP-glucose pyrophosphorylase
MMQAQPSTTIILCGGQINYSNLPIGTTQSNAMIPINGKPVIAWILNDLLDKGIHTATVVLREQDQRLQDFLRRAYHDRMDITLAPLTHQGTIIQSVQAGLRQHTSDGPVRIILGDTLIRDPFTDDRDFVYVSQVEESRRWCVVFANSRGQIVDLVDKQELTLPGPILALAGYYQLQHGEHLKHCVESCVANGERELSRILLRYNARYPIGIEPVTQWFDFGNIDNLVDARRRLLQPRHFNELVINPVLNTITKSSEDDQKLADELDWYLNIPDELKVLAPRIVSHRRVNGRLHIVQEYYGYPPSPTFRLTTCTATYGSHPAPRHAHLPGVPALSRPDGTRRDPAHIQRKDLAAAG